MNSRILPADNPIMAEADHNSRVVILSDTHLGGPGSGAGSPAALRPLWAGADRLILNGDTTELHDPTWRAQSAKHVLEIERMCAQDGVAVEMLSGNHDPWLTDQRFLQLAGGAIFLTHGDVLHPAISPWNLASNDLRKMNERALHRLEPMDRTTLSSRLSAAQFAASVDWDHLATDPEPQAPPWLRLLQRPAVAARVMWYWATLPGRALRFVRKNAPEARFFIFGHYHRSGVWRFGRRVVINTGNFGRFGRPMAAILEGGR